MNNDVHDFEGFMKRREEAARAYVRGDAAPLGGLVARVSPATFSGPNGGSAQGAEQVFSTYERGAAQFASDGDSNFEILQMAASDGLAYWVGFQRATARLDGSTEAIPLNLRVTEVFRREGDEWKLVHRHADTLASAAEEKMTEQSQKPQPQAKEAREEKGRTETPTPSGDPGRTPGKAEGDEETIEASLKQKQ